MVGGTQQSERQAKQAMRRSAISLFIVVSLTGPERSGSCTHSFTETMYSNRTSHQASFIVMSLETLACVWPQTGLQMYCRRVRVVHRNELGVPGLGVDSNRSALTGVVLQEGKVLPRNELGVPGLGVVSLLLKDVSQEVKTLGILLHNELGVPGLVIVSDLSAESSFSPFTRPFYSAFAEPFCSLLAGSE